MHSRTGYSGSPVFVYRTPGNNFRPERSFLIPTPEQALKKYFSDGFFLLLGIHCGQFPEEWKITEKKSTAAEEGKSLLIEGAVVTGLSCMTCVVPAESILAVLDSTELQMQRDKVNAQMRPLPPIIAESADKPDTSKGEAVLRTLPNTAPEPRPTAKAKTKPKRRSVSST